MPAAALHDAEAEQDGERAHVSDQQVHEPGPPDVGEAMIRGDEKVGAQRHRFPRHHERIGVVGEQHEAHAGEKQVVLQAQEAGRGALAAAEVAGCEYRDARGRRSEQEQEHARQGVEPHVHGQVRQPEQQHDHLGDREHRAERNAEQYQRNGAADRKEHLGHETQAAQRERPKHADQQPGGDDKQHPVQMEPAGRLGETAHRRAPARGARRPSGDKPTCAQPGSEFMRRRSAALARPCRSGRGARSPLRPGFPFCAARHVGRAVLRQVVAK